MSENRILELLARKMAGEATITELSELENLLKQYPDGLYYEELIRQLWMNKSAKDDTDAAYLLHTLKHPEIMQSDPTKHAGWSRQKMLVSALLMLAIIVVSVIYIYQSNSTASGTTEIFADKGIHKKVVLPDGTRVWLNCNSKINFSNQLNTDAVRRVQLVGEAYFDVTKNKHRPFVITTKKFSVQVLGTAFNIKAYPDDAVSEAALIRGSIELTTSGSQQQKILLKPNEKLTLADNSPESSAHVHGSKTMRLAIQSIKPIEIRSKQYIEETSWMDNKLVFKNESFAQLKPRLERWYNVTINVQNATVNKYHFTGIFQSETIDQALKAMQLIKPFKYELKYDEITIN
ncbi:DUF4974 domain-containing protein [Mucilaginibacter robiniae]|uniref:DUF4974 domain-containing protein n=1 Tax=Mucilaginibacter robiniae TaxID=2728022 RepID=A0A7L5E6C5_9SPHI|nr:FecR domain-containing protein [Mucilaginibacter robiniae]QJD97927.1 DUF4974 domain-containing protein [Mucilaginibacter robiniae]